MTTKQFITLFSILLILSIVYLYDTIDPIVSRSRCADYAMTQVQQAFPDAFIEVSEEFPRKTLRPEISQDALANYQFFYGFCMNKRGSE